MDQEFVPSTSVEEPDYARITVELHEVNGKIVRRAVVRTHDRISFRRCRRLWAWTSASRFGLERTEEKSYFWLGTGGHFALEDFYGYKKYSRASEAFMAYAKATRSDPNGYCPVEWKDLAGLTCSMLDYYEDFWSKGPGRDHHNTFWYNGVPQCEVDFEIPLDVELSPLARTMIDEVVYRGTFDRVIEDEYKRLWIYEYKFPARFEHFHSETDEQVSSYCWAGNQLYGRPIEGVYYQQHRKVVAEPPPFLKTTGKISVRKDMLTSRTLYRAALVNLYGSVEKAPLENVQFLNHLAMQETEEGDPFVNRKKIRRNDAQLRATDFKIKAECREMFDPTLTCYPNPTKDCSWDCPARDACVALDDQNGDFELLLSQALVAPVDGKKKERHSWRKYLPEAE